MWVSGTLAGAAFVLAAAAAVYILAGYPLLLALAPFRRSPAVRKDLSFQRSVTVILAVRDGGSFLRAKLESLLAQEYPKELMEILVVSDGSTDETDSIAGEFAGRGVRLLRQPQRGKAAALNAGLARATGEILFFTDVRQPLNRLALSHLVANFADASVGAATGELRLQGSAPGVQADLGLYWRYETWVRKRHSAIHSVFQASGCIYALRRDLAACIPVDTLADDAELAIRAYLAGYRVILDTAATAYDYPVVSGGEFRRRLRGMAGVWQVFARHPRLFLPANRMWLHFLSHKFGRLALPWAVVAAAAAAAGLPASPLGAGLAAGGLALVGLAALDLLMPAGFPLKRLSSPARTFLSMSAAALLSCAVFFVEPRRFWSPTRVEADGSKERSAKAG
jgi:cellulose synthase/poly-beta-1,6-N-acetylglucosamine synthase-like glycosyltransferase